MKIISAFILLVFLLGCEKENSLQFV